MAMDMFLVMDPVKGESRDKVYGPKNAIDVLAWSWGASNSGTAHVGGGAGAGKVNVQDISLTKYTDAASADLLMAVCNGKHFAEATLTVRKAGEHPVEYITIKMTEVLITSLSAGGSGGEDRLTENVTLNFAKVQMKYKKQKADGTSEDAGDTTWNIAENASE